MRVQKMLFKLIIAIITISVILPGCVKDKITKTYTILTPVYENKATVLSNIKIGTPESIKSPGKIYLYGQYIFLNEIDKGVHVINNTNPANPVNLGFIDIPGNLDIAVNGTTLYADFYSDLIAIDITNPQQAKFSKLLPHIFPDRQYANGFSPDTTKIIIDWIKKDTTIDISGGQGYGGWFNCRACLAYSSLTPGVVNDGSKNSVSVQGIAGSMSRFAIVNEYLYAVNNSTLESISISEALNPQLVKSDNVGWNIETIFPFKEKLFIGSASGIFIYDISNPSSPERKGNFEHLSACDPVVADDNYAFVTLRSGTRCQGFTNQLDVLDVANVNSPSLVKTYGMTNPHGLSKDGNTLFVCDGKDGLKVYDVSNVNDLKLIDHLQGMDTYDAIAWNKKLILVTSNGIRQYDYSDIKTIRLLSTISITH